MDANRSKSMAVIKSSIGRLSSQHQIFWLPVCLIILMAGVAAGCTTPPPATPTPLPVLPSPTLSPPSATPVPTATLLPATATLPPATTTASPTVVAQIIGPNNATDLQQIERLNMNGAQSLGYLSSSQTLALATGDQVSIYSLYPARQINSLPAANLTALATSPDQQSLAWASQDYTIHLYDLKISKEHYTLTENTGPVTSLQYSPQGSDLAAAAYNNQLHVWASDTGNLVQSWDLPYWLTNLSYSPDGTLLAGVDLPNFTVHIFHVATGADIKQLTWDQSASPALTGAYFSPDWKTIAWVARGTVQLMEVDSGKLGPTLEHEDFVGSLAWSPDSRMIATSAAGTVDGTFTPVDILWDAATGEKLKTIAQTNVTLNLSFSPDGRQLATLDNSGQVKFWAAAK